jgi:hypothetical protein
MSQDRAQIRAISSNSIIGVNLQFSKSLRQKFKIIICLVSSQCAACGLLL